MDRSLLPKLVATYDTPEGSASPAPPKTGRNGEATPREESRGELQPVAAKEVTEIASAEEDDLLHHQTATAGEAPPAENWAVGDAPCADASPSEETDWDEIAAFIAEARAAEKAAPAPPAVVKQTGDAGKRNTPVTPSEEDRFLMAVSLLRAVSMGLSLRQAAATVGV